MNEKTAIDYLPDLLAALGETGIMTGGSFVVVLVFGLAIGVLLRITAPDGPRPSAVVYQVDLQIF